MLFFQEIQERIDEINKLWQGLHDLVELKRVELISTISLQQFKNSLEYCVVSETILHFYKSHDFCFLSLYEIISPFLKCFFLPPNSVPLTELDLV